ncbi:hypothetical protein PO909_000776 [Leuciscus waleckii]
MLVFTCKLMGIFQHLLVNCSGRSFTDDVNDVGGADLQKPKFSVLMLNDTSSIYLYLYLSETSCNSRSCTSSARFLSTNIL